MGVAGRDAYAQSSVQVPMDKVSEHCPRVVEPARGYSTNDSDNAGKAPEALWGGSARERER